MAKLRIHLSKELAAELDKITAEINAAEVQDAAELNKEDVKNNLPPSHTPVVYTHNQIASEAVEAFIASRRLPAPEEVEAA